jgi:hypothetical protein
MDENNKRYSEHSVISVVYVHIQNQNEVCRTSLKKECYSEF